MTQYNSTDPKPNPPVSLPTYIFGFGWSLIITICAYLVVQIHLRSGHTIPSDRILLVVLIGLALTQFIVQAICFLHVGGKAKDGSKRLAFLFMVLIVAILVLGTLWIMKNLNYNMSSKSVNTYMNSQDGL